MLFAPLWNWFAGSALPWLGTLFKEWFTWLGRLTYVLIKLFMLWHLFLIGFVVLSIWAVAKLFVLVESFNLESLSRPALSMLQYYAFLNRFVPLSESLAGAVVVFDLWLGVTLFRWIKSMIPTISN